MAVAQSPPRVRAFLAGSIFFGTAIAVFEVLLNLYLQGEGLSKSEIGDLLSQRAIGTVLAALLAGGGFVKNRPTAVLAASSGLLFISLAALVLAPSLTIRQVAATAYGFALTFRIVLAAPFLFRHVRDEWLATMLGVDAAILAGTQVLGAVAAALLYPLYKSVAGGDAGALRYTLLTGAGLPLAAAICYLRTAGEGESRAVSARAQTETPEAPAPLLLYIKMCVPFFLIGAGAGLTIPYLNLYFADRFQAQAWLIGVFYAAVALATTVGFIASPMLAERLGLVRSVVFSEVASIPFFLILAWSSSLPLSVAAFLMRGLLMNLPYPLYSNLIMRIFGPAHRERANAITRLVWNLSWVATSRLAGWLLDTGNGNYVPVMVTTAGLYLAASTSFWLFFRKSGL